MIEYNSGWRPTKRIEGPTQEQIFTMPEYFALSRAEIYADPKCPDFLKRLLDEFPWDGRHNVIQVRPQDFRKGVPRVLGEGWHTDIMVCLPDRHRVCEAVQEFHLMVASWGNVVGTEFMARPFRARDIFDGQKPEFTPGELHELAKNQEASGAPSFISGDGQLVEYTSADLHRVARNPKPGRLRLMIVAFDCNSVPGGGLILPSISEKERK